LGNRALTGKGLPQLRATTAGIPAAAALHLNPLLGAGGQAPLALTLGNRLGEGSFQQHTAQAFAVHLAVALAGALANRRHVVVLRAAVIAEGHRRRGVGVGEPAGGVAPAQQ